MNNRTRVNSSGEGVSTSEASLPAEQDLIDQLNRGYVYPASAGPMWRAAGDAGVDMSLLEDSIGLSPAERLRAHQRALNQVLMLMEAAALRTHDSGS